jgi:lipopolysaccharide/colanic/teichoic acid biosynthesis glycosyltransferase
VETRSIGPGALRRLLDLAVASVALLVLAVPMLLVALAVRLTSRGPALYRQSRIGQGGELFSIFKFRTMVANAVGSTLTVPGDARVTPLGRFLRATCVDELPQLINVLFGQMTLVGPRPQTPALADRYPATLGAVFRYRPGLTGPGVLLLNDEDVLWGERDDVDAYYLREVAPARVAVDLDYLENPGLGRTIAILFETGLRVPARVFLRRPPLVAPSRDIEGQWEAMDSAQVSHRVNVADDFAADLPFAAAGGD